MNMKKLIISLTLISSVQLMPEWGRHTTPIFGPALNLVEDTVQLPAAVVDNKDFGYHNRSDEYRGEDYGYNQRHSRSYRKDDDRLRRDEDRLRKDEKRLKEDSRYRKDENRYRKDSRSSSRRSKEDQRSRDQRSNG